MGVFTTPRSRKPYQWYPEKALNPLKVVPNLHYQPFDRLKPNPLWISIGISCIVLFFYSSLRHGLFHSTAYDLAHFDQAIYLISQGQTPIVSLTGYHVLGSHADWILYFLAFFYKVYPDVHWLFGIQAIALSLGALPTWHLARHLGLKDSQALTMARVYLLYPLLFNINLFDFHPSVLAVPLLLGAILAARTGKIFKFTLAIILILGCRASLALTVMGLGFWLLFFPILPFLKGIREDSRQRLCGLIALILGITWLIIATQILIPYFRPQGVESLIRYRFLGNSLPEIIVNLFLKPGIVLSHIFTLQNLEYLALLLSPLIWGLSWRYLSPLIAAIPDLGLNLITDYPLQKDLLHQYSLPIVPFLLLCVMENIAAGGGWQWYRRWLLLWSVVGFVALAKYGYLWTRYFQNFSTWSATREGISLVQKLDETRVKGLGNLLTSAEIAPHLSHRQIVKLAVEGTETIALQEFNYVLLNGRYPGWNSNPELVKSLLERLRQSAEFELEYQRDEVYLFVRKG